jgi:hypothetical protein
MSRYPVISKEGAMFALRLRVEGKLDLHPSDPSKGAKDWAINWSAERLAHECSAIVRLANSHTGLAVALCNAQETPQHEKRQKNLRYKIIEKIRLVVPELRRQMLNFEFSGDPRGGATVTLSWDSFTNWSLG